VTGEHSGDGGNQWLIAHGERIWAAERELSERYSARVRSLVTASVSLLGFLVAGVVGLLIRADFKGIDPGTQVGVFAVLGLTTTIPSGFLITALLRLLRPRAVQLTPEDEAAAERFDPDTMESPQTASQELDLPDDAMELLQETVDPEAMILFSQLMQASVDLRKRNAKERKRIRESESALGNAMQAYLVAVVAFLIVFGIVVFEG